MLEKSGQMTKQTESKIDFNAATVHELRTSLTAIIASAELLADELQVGEENVLGKLIRSIIRNAHHINERLPRLSETEKLHAETFRLHLEPVDIKKLIHNVAARFYPKIQKKRQSLTLELPNWLPLVKVDRRHIEEILLALIANASKFSPEQGQIKVGTWKDGDSLVVQIADTGIGIPEKEQERIFQPYFQVNQGGEGEQAGSGLGLAIAKFLVEVHGGKIWLKSTVGQGSSFFFSLPL
ncbi:Alginate biosynthesis sensor protein KinB [subsurface metagenome]